MFRLLTHVKNRNFLRLWAAQLISQFGDRIHQLALVGLVAEKASSSPMGLAKLMAFTIIPVFVVQPFAGAWVDRWDRRMTLFVCDIFRGILVLLIPTIFIFGNSMIPIYLIVFLVFCFSRFYIPAKMSIIPDLVDEDNLLAANSLVSTTGMLAFVIGCALGGFFIDWWGARIGFFIDSATFFVSALVVFSIDMSKSLLKQEIIVSAKEVVKIKKTIWREIKDGFDYLKEHKEIRFIIDILFVLLAAAGAVYVVIIIFVQEAFHSVTKHIGILAVCMGVGLLLGAVGYGKFGKRFMWVKTIFFCLIFGGVMLITFALVIYNYPNIFVSMLLALLLGFIIGPIFIASNTIVHIVSDEQMRGKVFSALEIVIHFAFLSSMLVSSWLAGIIGRVWILIFVGIIIAFIGIIGFVRIGRGRLAFPV